MLIIKPNALLRPFHTYSVCSACAVRIRSRSNSCYSAFTYAAFAARNWSWLYHKHILTIFISNSEVMQQLLLK